MLKIIKIKAVRRISQSMLVILLIGLQAMAVSAGNAQTVDFETFLDNRIQSRLEEYHIPNAAVSVIKDGEVVYMKGFGLADRQNHILVNAGTTLFRIGSTSKLFVWTAVMQLVEAGKLDLNEDVNTYLDFEIPDQLLQPLKGKKPEPITLTHLMTHTPGFEDYPDKLFRLSADGLLPLDEYVRKHLPARIFPAGEVAAYSNYGTALAGYIVERVAGIPFSDYVEQNIFMPLNMNSSTFRQSAAADSSPDVARPHRYIDGEYIEGSFEYLIPEPAGSMSTTAADMARFMTAHLNGGIYNRNRILKEETIEKMHAQHFTHHPDLGGMTLGFMEGVYNGKRVLFHGGGTMLFHTGLYLLPEENMGFFITFSGGSHLITSEIFQAFMDEYFPVEALPDSFPPAGSRERAAQYTGEYQMNRRSITTAEKSTSLFLGVITVKMDEKGYLLVTSIGETNPFVEIQPGVYQNLREGRTQDYFGPFHRIVFKEDPYGRVLLTTDGPMTYSKAPLYSTMGFTIIVLGVLLLVILLSLVYWIIRSLTGLFKRGSVAGSRLPSIALGMGIGSGASVLVLLANLLNAGDIHPVYQLPAGAYNPVDTSAFLHLLPWLMTGLASLLVLSSVLAWREGFWRRIGRIHYTIFTIAYLGLLWAARYWNLFL